MGRPRMERTKIACPECSILFEIRLSEINNGKRRFCSKTCSSSYNNRAGHANGTRKIGFDLTKTNYEKWVEKFGVEIANQKQKDFQKNVSVAILATDMSHQKEVAGKLRSRLNRENTGKTNAEIYGVERAQELSRARSIASMGSRNPAFGKVYMNGGKSVKGHYKGFFFRSLLEYSFMKHLELQGYSLKDDVGYECFKVPYLFEGRDRTYTIDFYIAKENVVYEVKPSYTLNKITHMNETKWNAAKTYFIKQNIEFKIVSENDFRKVSFGEAQVDVDIVWNEKTFAFFKRTM